MRSSGRSPTVHEDRDRLSDSLAHLDVDRAAAELENALRRSDSSEGHRHLIASLRERYESIHRIHNRVTELGATIERALADVDVLAARALELGARDDAWRLDETVRRLEDDLLALEAAHAEVADLSDRDFMNRSPLRKVSANALPSNFSIAGAIFLPSSKCSFPLDRKWQKHSILPGKQSY